MYKVEKKTKLIAKAPRSGFEPGSNYERFAVPPKIHSTIVG